MAFVVGAVLDFIPQISPWIIIDNLWVSILGLVLGLMATLYGVYYFSDIVLDESGLYVEFLWYKCHVNWKDIVKIRVLHSSPFARSWLVETKSLTSIHRLYGLLHGFTINPSFLIHSNLLGYEQILHEIKRRMEHSRN